MEIAGYKLGRVFLKDGCCTTFNALDTEHGKSVLVKVFTPELSADPSFLTHFQRVTGQLAGKKLGHNIFVRDAFIKDGTCAFVTNFSPHTVSRHEGQPGYSEEEIIKFGIQLAESLTLLHSRGIVHGGVDPSNIHILDNNDVVLDAVVLQRTMPNADLFGPNMISAQDALYLAPEAGSELTGATDFFSLGVVLYELLTDSRPYSAATEEALRKQKINDTYRPLDPEYAHFKPLFDGLLSGTPYTRTSSLDGFLSALSRCMEKDDLLAASSMILQDSEISDPPNPNETNSTTSRNALRALTPSILGALAVVALLAIFWVFNNTQQPAEVIPSKPIASTPGEITKSTASSSTGAEKLPRQPKEPTASYDKALALYHSNNYEAALRMLSGDTASPDSEQADALHAAILHKMHVGKLLSDAERQFNENKFISPAGDNALETYRELAKLSPDVEQQVTHGMQLLTDHFLTAAREQLDDLKLDAAQQSIVDGLKVQPDHAPLLSIQADINKAIAAHNNTPAPKQPAPPPPLERQVSTEKKQRAIPQETVPARSDAVKDSNTAARQQVQAAERKRREQMQRERLIEEKRLAAEQAQLAEEQRLEKERLEQQLRTERLLAQQRELVLREAEVNRLLSVTEQSIGDTAPTRESLNEAISRFHSLKKLAGKDPRVPVLLDKLIDAHFSLASSQKDSQEYTDSISTIRQGLSLNPDNGKLLKLRKTVEQEVAREEAKSKELPIIGTF